MLFWPQYWNDMKSQTKEINQKYHLFIIFSSTIFTDFWMMVKTKATDHNLCLKFPTDGYLVKNAEVASCKRFLESVSVRAEYKDEWFVNIQKRFEHTSALELAQMRGSWDRHWYQDTVHSGRIERMKKRWEKCHPGRHYCVNQVRQRWAATCWSQ